MTNSLKLMKNFVEMEFSLLLSFAVVHSILHSAAAELREYCQSEHFNVTCGRYEVIVMETADYGRMNAGRCVTNNLGCSANVIEYFDRQCSGQRHCSVYIADSTLHRMAPCPKDFTSYLEAKYTCITVSRPTDSLSACRRDRHVTLSGDAIGYLASVTSLEHGYGLVDCPWRILAGDGQTVRLTMTSFGGKRNEGQNQGHMTGNEPCHDVGEVREPGSKKQTLAMCVGAARERVVFTSAGSDVTVQLLPKETLRSLSAFVVKYQVLGCQTMKGPAGGSLKIDGNTATIRCNRSKETWYLTCTENQWIGHVGNCTDKSTTARSAGNMPYSEDGFPYGILVVVAIGVALGVLIGGVLLSFVAYYMKSRQTQLRRHSHDEEGDEGDPAELTKQIMDETDSAAAGAYGARQPPPPQHQHHLYRPPPPAQKGLLPSDVRYVQDLQYSRTLIAYADDEPSGAGAHPPHCVCPPRGSAAAAAAAAGGPPCANPSCRVPVAMPPDVYAATKRPLHLYEMPEST